MTRVLHRVGRIGLHELTFVVLFLALVLIPLRRRQPWAWWTCWAIMIANLGYTFTIARHDSTILTRSLIADIAVSVFLLLCAPAVFTKPGTAPTATVGSVKRTAIAVEAMMRLARPTSPRT